MFAITDSFAFQMVNFGLTSILVNHINQIEIISFQMLIEVGREVNDEPASICGQNNHQRLQGVQ